MKRPIGGHLWPVVFGLGLMACGDEQSAEVSMESAVCSPTDAMPCPGAEEMDASMAHDAEAQPSDAEAQPRDADPATWTRLADRPCPDDSILTYYNFGRGFMSNWCNGCHSEHLAAGDRADAPVGVDFNSLEMVRLHADRIWARSGDLNNTMPPFGGGSTDARRALGEWLGCGAP